MAKCPYCDAEIHVFDFFEYTENQTKKGRIKRKIGEFKGEQMSSPGLGFGKLRMYSCPSCDKILGFSEAKYKS